MKICGDTEVGMEDKREKKLQCIKSPIVKEKLVHVFFSPKDDDDGCLEYGIPTFHWIHFRN